ncbi:GNAT family N-acetyltransferase [Silvimonas amylolytica]|uniref:N-acetyltransferase n=1 Tax=Silvimonas amylolytica TaxID=449663 RepID=A0ABQ2PK10_9NEIS|nr:GNAT family N-acetyltransferase [Silvimonas amylolytica]GGP25955.1 N-acetyltransferase [Silvimonas amylolytica]
MNAAQESIAYPDPSALTVLDLSALRFRQASAADAGLLAPLIHEAAQTEFAWLFEAPAAETVAFLQHALAEPMGHFSWQHLRVATLADQPVAVMGVQDGRGGLLNGPYLAMQLMQYFGWRQTAGILRRGLVLQREVPVPQPDQTLIAHCATAPRWRRQGVFGALFQDALGRGLIPVRKGQDIILDVLASNISAMALYRKLGFVTISTRPFAAAGVPDHLFARRMRYRGAPGNGASLAVTGQR